METPPISNSPSGYPVAGSNSGRSITSLMMGVFTAPGQTFDEFCKRPRLIVPLITVLILAAITGAVTVKQTGMIQYDMLKTSTTIPASALEEIHQKALDSGPVSGALGPFFGILIGSIIGALIAWFLGSFVFGGKAKFSAVWAVGIMGSLISVVGGLIRMPLILAKDTAYVSLGFAALMPGKDFTSILYALLSMMDFFVIWGVIVTGIGYAAVFGISRGKGIMVAAIPAVIVIGLMVGLIVLGMSFSGVELSWV